MVLLFIYLFLLINIFFHKIRFSSPSFFFYPVYFYILRFQTVVAKMRFCETDALTVDEIIGHRATQDNEQGKGITVAET